MTMLFANNATSRLYAAVAPGDGTVRVQAGHGALFPQPTGGDTFKVTLEDRRSGQIEICVCTARSGDILTVTRAQEGTAAQAFALGATVSNRLTAETLEFLLSSTGVTEAPADNKIYGRKNEAWTESVARTEFTPVVSRVGTLEAEMNAVEAVNDSQGTELVRLEDIKVDEAPIDAAIYGRQGEAWVATVSAVSQDARDDAQEAATVDLAGRVTTNEGQLLLKANIASPAFTGNPTAPTSAPGDNDTSIATTAFIAAAIANFSTSQDTRDDAQDAAIALRLTDAPSDGLTYGRKNAAWATVIGGASMLDGPPAAPLQNGQLWFETDSGNTYCYYVDPSGAPGQWVQIAGSLATLPPSAPEYISSVPLDMRAGFKTVAKFVVNSKADGTGNDLLSIARADGAAVHTGASFDFRGSGTAASQVNFYGGGAFPNASGLLQFMNSAAVRRGYLYANSAGNMELYADTGQLTIGTSAPSQSLNISATGTLNLTGGSGAWAITNGGLYNQTGGSAAPLKAGYLGAGTQYGMTLRSGSSTGVAIEFSTSSGIAGTINHGSGLVTAYNTSSDERLKDFIGEYDPDEAIRIIRADPVRDWHWRKDGSYAVGWGAQTSYEVSPDLASPPLMQEGKALTDDIDDPDFMPWGTDQSKRTPYLWAALSRALDKIDALEARLAQLEAR